MAKQKRDYSKLKLEFFESEYDSVNEFFLQKYNQNTAKNKQIATSTKGRGKQKQEYKAKIVEDTLKEVAKKQVKELAVPMEDLMKGKKAILQLLLHQVSKYVKANQDKKTEVDIDVGDAEKILKMFKTELGEPTSYQKTDSVIKDETSDQNPLKEKLLKLKQNNQGNINSGKKKK